MKVAVLLCSQLQKGSGAVKFEIKRRLCRRPESAFALNLPNIKYCQNHDTLTL